MSGAGPVSGPTRRVDLAREAAFSLGSIQVRPASRELIIAGKAQVLQPRVMQVLVALARRAGGVVSRDELVESCWEGLAVSEDAINRCIAQLRKLSDQDGGASFVIDTIARVGYRLTATRSSQQNVGLGGEPQRQDLTDKASKPQPADSGLARNVTAKPSIAVLPFQNLSGDEDQDYFVDGMVEEIITALSRVRAFPVIARNSSFVYKNRQVSVRQVGGELGVRYVLEGSVRKAGDRVRIHAQLIDATTDQHIWADRYDGALKDIFDLEDRITSSIVGAIQPSIFSAEIERAKRKRPDNLDAYDCVLRALPGVWAFDKNMNDEALIQLRRAMDLEAGYALAISLAAWCEARRSVYNWTNDHASARAEGLRLARLAGGLRNDDPTVLAMLCAAHTVAADFQVAKALIEKALALDPNSAWAWHRSGWLRVYAGEPETAIEQFQKALRLSPFDPLNANLVAGIGAAHFVAKRYEQAVSWMEKALLENPRAVWAYRILIAAQAHLDRMDDAKRNVATLLHEFPGLTVSQVVSAMVFSNETLGRLADGLKKAGLKE